MKPVEFVGDSLDCLRQMPLPVRRAIGYQLDRVQNGLAPSDWKPLVGVGAVVRELRVRDAVGAWRVAFVASLADAVYVLHCFQKKTQKTAPGDLDTIRTRFSELMLSRNRRK